MKFLEEKFVPFAAAIGSEKHLVSLRDSFTTIMPLTIAGALGVLFNYFHQIFGPSGLNVPAIYEGYGNFITTSGLTNIFGAMNNGTVGMISILIAALFCSKLTDANGGDGVAAVAVGIACYLAGCPIVDGAIATSFFGATGLFVAMISSLIAGTIYPKLSANPKLKITMPDGVPPAVSKSFSSLIPAIITLVVMCGIFQYIPFFTGQNAWDLVKTFISSPLTALSQGIFMVIVMYFMITLLWCFGLHGANIVGSVTTPILEPLSLENVALYAAGKEPVHTFTTYFQSSYVHIGGSGATIGLLVAIFLFSKSKATRTIGNLSLAPGLFNINEPLTFGLPIVMNPVFMIPFIAGEVLVAVLSYYVTELGLIGKTCIAVPWVTTPVIGAFLATGGDFRAAIWVVIEIVILTAIWTPFIMMNDKMTAGEAE